MSECVIGVVVRPFGIRGEMKTRVLSELPDRFRDLDRVTLAKPDRTEAGMKVVSARPHQGHVLLKVEGVDTVEGADEWRGAEVRAVRMAAPPLDEGNYYVADLVGMEVRRTDGRSVGVVGDVVRYPAQDLLVVGDALIPAVRAIVVEVDMEARIITVDPPAGLLPGDDD